MRADWEREAIAAVEREAAQGHVRTLAMEVTIIGDTLEPLIRADERERERGRRIDRYDTTTIQEVLSDEREYLRAEVEALRTAQMPIADEDGEWVDVFTVLSRDDVLALFDGSSDE